MKLKIKQPAATIYTEQIKELHKEFERLKIMSDRLKQQLFFDTD